MQTKTYKDLIVWQKSMDLTVEIYRLVELLPKTETYALSDQMRRAVVSIPANIAEGRGRFSKKEFANFLTFARGSQTELETHLEICVRLGYLSEQDTANAFALCEEINKMLNAFISKLKKENQ